jgi:DNA-binding transcriptional regulator YiaG
MLIKPGSKYYALFEHLQAASPKSVTLTFSQIETLMQATLPDSARSKRSWWSNRDSKSALQASAWVQAGYHIATVDLEQETATFEPFKAEYSIQRTADGIFWDQSAIRALRKHMHLTQSQFANELGVRRQTISEWENGVYLPERSTAKHLQRIAQQHEFE